MRFSKLRFYRMVEDPTVLEMVLNKLKQDYDKRGRTGVHVSDLVQICLREQVFRRIKPKPITTRTAFYFMLGEACHVAAQALFAGVTPEKQLQLKGVQGHIDMVLDLTGTPIEVKTSTARIRFVADHYIKQLSYYIVLSGKTYGHLLYFWLSEGRYPDSKDKASPGFGLYKVELTQDEINQIKQDIKVKQQIFTTALEDYKNSGDLLSLINVPAAKFDDKKKFKCDTCRYVVECNSID